ncbi:MAG TPA: hypothetical protein VGG48_10550 [Rhizomicrobium sp.]|jgi:hypothetical protein
MAEPIVILALHRRRDRICGVIAEYERKIREAQHDLGHINASLRLFELTGDPSEFPAYIDLNRLLRRGETTRLCLAALAEEGPLDTRELAQRVMRAKGLNEGTRCWAKPLPCASSRPSGLSGQWSMAERGAKAFRFGGYCHPQAPAGLGTRPLSRFEVFC